MIIDWRDHIGSNSFYNGGWVKQVTAVDTSKQAGYAFEGDFVSGAAKGKSDCPDGLYIVCSIQGSRSKPRKEVAVYRITGDEVTQEIDWAIGNDWALQIRPQVAELLGTKQNPLAKFSTEDLLAELKARGVEV